MSLLFQQWQCMDRYLSPIGWILEMVTSSLGSSFSRAQEVVKEAVPPSVSHRDPKLSPTVNGLSLYLRHQTQCIIHLVVLQVDSLKLNRIDISFESCHTYFGGPEVKPGSSNMSSLEREEDLAPTGVSCSIVCISDITEWDTALKQDTHTYWIFWDISPNKEKRNVT